MRYVAALCILAAQGCASHHSTLHARTGPIEGQPFTARCLLRDDLGEIDGKSQDFTVGAEDEARAVSTGEVTVWGRARTISGVDYSYGQLCLQPGSCVDYVYLDDGKVKTWLEIETVRVARGETVFETRLEESSVITDAAAIFDHPKKLATFDQISIDYEAAASSRSSALSYVPVASNINEIRTAVSEASAMIGSELMLPTLRRYFDEHHVLLYGGAREGLRAFEVVRVLCAAPSSSEPRPASR